MSVTQAYSVDWTVSIQPEGDVSQDVAELKVIEEEGNPDSASVILDTSERPHALEEQRQITIEITDGNNTITFDGFTDAVKDDETRPIVTVDARESQGILDDTTAVGNIDEDNVFRVIDAVIDSSAGQVREISFDPSPLESNYGTFAGTTDYGKLDIAYSGSLGAEYENWNQHETSSEGKQAELRIGNYTNNTGTTYEATLNGQDTDGNTVQATFSLPPGTDANDAYGTDTFKLALEDGNEKWTEVNSITTNIPPLTTGSDVIVSGQVFNFVKTSWNFQVDGLTSVQEAISRLVSYISGLDDARDWEFYADDTDELIVQPETTANPDRYEFREGDNVLKPVANRDLDGVRNFIKVSGAGDVNAWIWAYNGDLQAWIAGNPFESGDYPSSGVIFDTGQAPQNHIDQINLRAESLSSNSFTSSRQALEIGKKALREYLRTPVSGQAPVAGIHPASPGDEAEVYYPSRGIPAKVTDNVYKVKKVEYTVTPETAKTVIDFGTPKRNLGDVISGGGGLGRNDISNNIQQFSDSTDSGSSGEGGGGVLVVGTLDSQNSDGTWTVTGEDGETYEDVRVI